MGPTACDVGVQDGGLQERFRSERASEVLSRQTLLYRLDYRGVGPAVTNVEWQPEWRLPRRPACEVTTASSSKMATWPAGPTGAAGVFNLCRAVGSSATFSSSSAHADVTHPLPPYLYLREIPRNELEVRVHYHKKAHDSCKPQLGVYVDSLSFTKIIKLAGVRVAP